MKRFNPCTVSSPPEPVADPVAIHNHLAVGTRVHCLLYGGMDGIIYNIRGEQKPETISQIGRGVGVMGGNAHFDIVFTGGRAHTSSVPEAIVLGSVQWSIEDGIATADEIKQSLEVAEARRLAGEAEQLRKNQERAGQRAALPKLYPWLKPSRGSAKSSHALGAANLKSELARAFPGVKFSVKSESYSGGDAIRVHWDGGPTTQEVTIISDKYREGSFDGMSDSYDYNHDNVWPDVFGGAKYVTESRHFPEAFHEQVGRALCALQRIEYEGQFTRHLLGSNDDRDLAQYVNELLSRTRFPVGAQFKGVGYTPDAERVGNNWCRIVFDLPAPTLERQQPDASPAAPHVIETEHTKLKHKLFVVQLGTRVERATYEQLNRQAQALGGYYSSYRREGAVPGFIFKTREPAEKFVEAVRVILGLPDSALPAPTPVLPPQNPDPNAIPAWRKRFFQK